jgi:hypothetical protein
VFLKAVLELDDFRRLQSLFASHKLKLDFRPLRERFEAFHLNCGKMDKYILLPIRLFNKSISLVLIEPLDTTSRHTAGTSVFMAAKPVSPQPLLRREHKLSQFKNFGNIERFFKFVKLYFVLDFILSANTTGAKYRHKIIAKT